MALLTFIMYKLIHVILERENKNSAHTIRTAQVQFFFLSFSLYHIYVYPSTQTAVNIIKKSQQKYLNKLNVFCIYAVRFEEVIIKSKKKNLYMLAIAYKRDLNNMLCNLYVITSGIFFSASFLINQIKKIVIFQLNLLFTFCLR